MKKDDKGILHDVKNKQFTKILPESPEGILWWAISSHVNMDWLIILLIKPFNFTDRFTIRKAKRGAEANK